MARRRSQAPLNVFLNGRLVGVLRRETSGAIDFRYHRDWLAWESAFAVSLSLPLREDRYIGAPVIAVFDNLLPDNPDIRKKVAERVGADGVDPYNLLSAVGRDCVGALQFLPDGVDPGAVGAVDAEEIGDADIAALLTNLASAPLGLGDDDAFRISLAGAQEKTALLHHKKKWWKPTGTTATTHILKPQIGEREGIDLTNSVENEYLCLKLLQACGLTTAEADIIDFDGCRALSITRFDRRWTKDGRLLRLPQEDCCQARSIPPTKKYEAEGGPGIADIVQILKGSDTPDEDIGAFMRAQVLFWLLGATDGHAKNFSIFLTPGGRYRLTPIYDVVSTQPMADAGQISRNKHTMAMAVGRNRHYAVHEIAPRHFLQTAELAGIGTPVMQSVLDDIATHVIAQAESVVSGLPEDFPAQLVESLLNGIGRRARLFGITEVA